MILAAITAQAVAASNIVRFTSTHYASEITTEVSAALGSDCRDGRWQYADRASDITQHNSEMSELTDNHNAQSASDFNPEEDS